MGKALLLLFCGAIIWLLSYSAFRGAAGNRVKEELLATFPTPYARVFEVHGIRLGMRHEEIAQLLDRRTVTPEVLSQSGTWHISRCEYPAVRGKSIRTTIVFGNGQAGSVESTYAPSAVAELGGAGALKQQLQERLGEPGEHFQRDGGEIYLWTHLRAYRFIIALALRPDGSAQVLYYDELLDRVMNSSAPIASDSKPSL